MHNQLKSHKMSTHLKKCKRTRDLGKRMTNGQKKTKTNRTSIEESRHGASAEFDKVAGIYAKRVSVKSSPSR